MALKKFVFITETITLIGFGLGLIFRGFQNDWITIFLVFTITISIYRIIRYLKNKK